MRCLFFRQLWINSFSFDPSAKPRATRLHNSHLREHLPSFTKVRAEPCRSQEKCALRCEMWLDDVSWWTSLRPLGNPLEMIQTHNDAPFILLR